MTRRCWRHDRPRSAPACALGVTPDIYALFIAYSSFVAVVVPVLGNGRSGGSLAIALQQRVACAADVAVGAALLVRFFDFSLLSLVGLALYAWAERRNPASRNLTGSAAAHSADPETEDL